MRFVRLLTVASLCLVSSGCFSYAATLHIRSVQANGPTIDATDVVESVASIAQAYSLKPIDYVQFLFRVSDESYGDPTLTVAGFSGYSRQPGRRRTLVLVNVSKADGAPSVFIRNWDSPSDSPVMDELAFAIQAAIEAELGPGTVRFERTPDTPRFLSP